MPDIEGVLNSPKTKDEWIADRIPSGNYQITFTFNQKVVTKNILISDDSITRVFVNMMTGEFESKSTLDIVRLQERAAALKKAKAAIIDDLTAKMKEATNHYRDYSFGRKTFSAIGCYLTPGREGYLTVTFVRDGDAQYKDTRFTYTFRIDQMSKIEVNNASHGQNYNPYGVSSPVGMIEVAIPSKTAILVISERDYGRTYFADLKQETLDGISIPFLQSNPANFAEIKKLLQQLKDLK
jgi:hypothetical protein